MPTDFIMPPQDWSIEPDNDIDSAAPLGRTTGAAESKLETNLVRLPACFFVADHLFPTIFTGMGCIAFC
jgi:hypothetical protein